MPRPSNTVTVEIDRDTTIELVGVRNAGRCEMTVHQVIERKGGVITATVSKFRLQDEQRRSLIDALEMMR